MGGESSGRTRPVWTGRFARLIVVASLALLGVPLGVLTGVGTARGDAAPSPAPPASDVASVEALAEVPWPPELGQPAFAVYVEATGHTVGGTMLDYWRATGRDAVFGNPISEPFALDGLYSQAFERGIFQFHPDAAWSVDPMMRLFPLGRTILRDRTGTFRADGKRAGGGGDRRANAWRTLDPDSKPVERALADGGLYVEASGHTLAGPFLDWYRDNEGDFYLGNPLSQPLAERGRTAQWFEGGLLLADGDTVTLAPLPSEQATRLAIDTDPIPRDGLPDYDESLFWVADNPNPVGDMSAPGRKWIEVSLSEQKLWAYQGDELIMTSFVSTGLPPNETEHGRFRVRYKVLLEDMRGATDAEGNVVWVAGDLFERPPDAIPYGVPDVPHVMYVNLDAEALHGAYWHNSFGIPTSHGCINLPLDVAAFLYGWAPLGTEVIVYE